MKARLLGAADGPQAGGEDTFVLVFETGDEVMQELLCFGKREGLTAGHFTAIGAFEDVTLGYFDWPRKEYRRIAVREQVEVLSMVGDVALEGDVPKRFDPSSKLALIDLGEEAVHGAV